MRHDAGGTRRRRQAVAVARAAVTGVALSGAVILAQTPTAARAQDAAAGEETGAEASTGDPAVTPDEAPPPAAEAEAPSDEASPSVEDAPPADGDINIEAASPPPPDEAPPPTEEPPPPEEAPESIEPTAAEPPPEEPPPPPPPKEKPKAVALGSFLQAGMGTAWDISAPAFDRYRDELFEGEEASGRVTWGRFAWAIEDMPLYFQAGMMRTEGELSEGYDGGSFQLQVRALSVDLGVGAQWTSPPMNPFTVYGDAALVVISADTVAEGGAGTQRNEDSSTSFLLRGGLRAAIYGPLAADVVFHAGGMMGHALTGGLSYVF